MHSVNVLEQGAEPSPILGLDFEYFQGEKSGTAEGWREKSCFGPLKIM